MGSRIFRIYLHRMGKTATSYCLYEEGKVIDDGERTIFECASWQSYRFILTSIIGTFTATNIVGVIIASRENQASMENYVAGILRLNKRDLDAAQYVGVPSQMILACVSGGIRNRDLLETVQGPVRNCTGTCTKLYRDLYETQISPQLSIRNLDASMNTRGQRAKKVSNSK